MYALSLHQPWAAAIALGDKKVETRGKGTNLRGMLAIQSAKVWGPYQRNAANELHVLLDKPKSYFNGPHPANRRGAVVAVARIAGCEVMTDELIWRMSATERCLGGWEPGRFAYFLEDIVPLEDPLPLKGQQGFWTLASRIEAEVLERAGLAA